MHAAFRQYFEGQLFLASIADLGPRTILDLGCGSGAWAIDAAMQFPDAAVLAVDISPLPDRMIPNNLTFGHADLTQELNFAGETFDVVHSRFVVAHVPNAKDVIACAARLVRPGGLFLIADMNISHLVETDVDAGLNELGLVLKKAYTQVFTDIGKRLPAQAVNGDMGKEYEQELGQRGIIRADGGKYFSYL
ncbi:S-adenosyl-L-methionine-dependent methyltransferase [Mycena rosella]|uniref:S-adenosyl-L-methionine-dependent methyltransferase n=1 Tax=Mycena rosella TaxID=1033263 RepID=A0AAD7CH15_MYCRO|nr:S-adenosyl-L-methionine-dependent methyltransferase [Mycena rosella]